MLAVPLATSGGSVEICDIHVGLATAPQAASGSSTSGGESGGSDGGLGGGAIAGVAVGAVLGVAALAAAGVYVARQRGLRAAPADRPGSAKGWDSGLDAAEAQASAHGSGVAPAAAAGGAAGAGALMVAAADAPSGSGGSSGGLFASPASTYMATPRAQPDPLAAARNSGASSSQALEATDLSKLPPGFNNGG